MSKKLFSAVALIVVLGVVLSGCAKNRNNVPVSITGNKATTTAGKGDGNSNLATTTSIKSSTTSSVTSTTTTSQLDTNDWQVYSDKENGVEFRYQPYWKKATYSAVGDLAAQKIMKMLLFNNYSSGQKEALPLLNVSMYSSDKKFGDSDKGVLGEYLENKKIGAIDVEVYKKESYFGTGYSALVKLKNGSTLLVKVDQIKNGSESLEIFNQIMSTIKFI